MNVCTSRRRFASRTSIAMRRRYQSTWMRYSMPAVASAQRAVERTHDRGRRDASCGSRESARGEAVTERSLLGSRGMKAIACAVLLVSLPVCAEDDAGVADYDAVRARLDADREQLAS